ncbi:MAG TPA: aminoacyl-histidine dipeptidase, partial [Candidatus Eisenbacteria bacterium]|nr:aminoacyl-histidine dipeptidase [Candidatus Eisenbacteria bacterium]
MVLKGLDPKELWKHFDKIRTIPHCSGNEGQIAEYLLSYSKKMKLEAEKDKNGNVLIRVPATPGHEEAPTVVLQGHMDMVGEKDSNVDHDFFKDPIEIELDGDWVKAKGTTLGADNGIGMAAALAVIESPDVVHGPLELLFTVDEEVGLTGAGKLEPGFITGEMMLNLDTEELGAIYVGCAGGGDSTIKLPFQQKEAPAGTKGFVVKVAGLKGGHSGIDIHEKRGNAIKILARVLLKALESQPCHLVSLQGGSKRNAIPREAAAELMVLETGVDELAEVIGEETAKIKTELGELESDLTVLLEPSEQSFTKVLDAESQKRILNLLNDLPHGVEAMSKDIPGLVETSNNVATVTTSGNAFVIGTSTRSSIAGDLQKLRDKIRSIAEDAGAEVEENVPYPGWKPELDSNLLGVAKKIHKREFGKEPE